MKKNKYNYNLITIILILFLLSLLYFLFYKNKYLLIEGKKDFDPEKQGKDHKKVAVTGLSIMNKIS